MVNYFLDTQYFIKKQYIDFIKWHFTNNIETEHCIPLTYPFIALIFVLDFSKYFLKDLL